MSNPANNAPALKWWLYGLLAFAIVIAMSVPLQIYTEFGIVAHQEAATGMQVDRIQAAWRAGGVYELGLASMVADLVFIGIYTFGAWIAGQSFRRFEQSGVRLIGNFTCLCAAIFGLTDYTETALQCVQMLQGVGTDWMAGTAATVKPIKSAAFIASVLAILAGIFMRRRASKSNA